MGLLRDMQAGAVTTLGERTVVGRSSACLLQVHSGRVSAEHALIVWSSGSWSVRDLGSTNGTFVDGVRLQPGQRVQCAVGSRLAFADPRQIWTLVDGTGPGAQARNLDTGELRCADGEILVLPDEESIEVSVYPDASGRWVVEADDGTTALTADLALLDAGGQSWRLHLPQRLDPTVPASSSASTNLRFFVSADEEFVQIVVMQAGRELKLTPRSHHYLLLTLARERLKDAHRSPSEQGWVTEERVARMLRLSRQTVKVQIHRARRELGRLGVVGAQGVVERRPGTGQLRLGVKVHSVIVGE